MLQVTILKLVVSYFFLGYASLSDWRKREVPDKVWLGLAVSGGALTAYEVVSFLQAVDFASAIVAAELTQIGVSILLMFVVAFLIFQSGLFGGADAKAFMAISLMMPITPSDVALSFPLAPISQITNPFFPLSVFNNAILLSALMAVYILIRNFYWSVIQHRPLFDELPAQPLGRRVLAVLTGYKIPVSKAEKLRFMRVLTSSFNGQLQLRLRSDEEQVSPEVLSSVKNVWVTPLLPMMIFIMLGFTCVLLFGDFALGIVSALARIFFGV